MTTDKQQLTTFLFHRIDDGNEFFYKIQLTSESEVAANAECNPGTLKVTSLDGRTVWSLHPEPTGPSEEVVNITDIFMRILGGRRLEVCLNSLQLSVITLASDLPKEGRDFVSLQIKALLETIDGIKDDESPQLDAFDTKPKLTLVGS